MKTKEINFKVTLDENNLPQKIEWRAEGQDYSECKSMMVALWDAKENNTLRIDLWTRDMTVDEMKKFFHQNAVTMSDTYSRATGDDLNSKRVKHFFSEL